MSSAPRRSASDAVSAPDLTRRLLWSGVAFGVGVAAFVDETVFHQLLHWHHFYDLSTPTVGLVSDGFFHAFGWFATVAALFVLADVRRRGGGPVARWWGPVALGAGAFQLYDGTIQHKLMRIHQIRYVPDVVVYDIVWNVVAVVLIAGGSWWWRRSGRTAETRRAPA